MENPTSDQEWSLLNRNKPVKWLKRRTWHLRTRGARWMPGVSCLLACLGSCHMAWSKAFFPERKGSQKRIFEREFRGVDGGHEGGDYLEISSMADWKFWTLLFQKVWSFQSWNLELVIINVLIFFSFFLIILFVALLINSCGVLDDDWRHLSIERNRFLSVRLFPELSRVSKEQPPIAKFVLRVSNVGPNRKLYISPGMY